jgi:hypothetical protein
VRRGQDVGFTIRLNNADAHSQVINILTFAYENRDHQIGQLFTLERLHRRTLMALEMQKLALLDLRTRRDTQHAELEKIKTTLGDASFKAEVDRFSNRESPSGTGLQPSSLAFVYNAPGMTPSMKDFSRLRADLPLVKPPIEIESAPASQHHM